MGTQFFDSPLFESIICMILIYALLSLLVSTITEAINSYFKERGSLLYKTLSQGFNDNLNVNFAQLLYTHPAIENLKKDNTSLPQYISPQMFSNSLVDVVSNYARDYMYNEDNKLIELKTGQPEIFDRFKAGIEKMQHTDLKLLLLNMVEKSALQATQAEKLNALNQQLQQWFNDQMERTSGWYKVFLRTRLFWISLVVVIALNVDSVHLFQTLYRSPGLRAQLQPIAENLADNYDKLGNDTSITKLERAYRAAAATQIKNDSARVDTALVNNTAKIINQLRQLDSITKNIDSSRTEALKRASKQIDDIASLGLPIGWKLENAPLSWFTKPVAMTNGYFAAHKTWSWSNMFVYLLGILISAVSLSFGAPFWFDLLLKAVNIRRAGTKPSTDQK